ncbi:hypothetical protein H6G93_28405 [Nostoc sp. FACHB-973]|uniref:Uncharacterized protein n=1 Tax=Desmonostoc muscorum LEGE 12446 TaxID=1828758 RepID=A0A8J7A021_DESMC|nr:hypothetical protein [Desmonostoc muscorum]MBD2518815.1 hypothetical protein [Nostoc sp. FACHB-973]MBX9259195.1 hypothetical protein [Desmonostoc muscorum CCALA 125]MCF2148611.1 hypothetical protein [Desmonostoc muscorum LEGE 12446]
MMELKDKIEEFTVVKGNIPKSLKIQFKVFCVQKNAEMSEILEILIRQWIQAGAPVPQLHSNLLKEELEEIKGYIPKNLKYQFKIICKHKKVTMRSVLYGLITQWVEMGGSIES